MLYELEKSVGSISEFSTNPEAPSGNDISEAPPISLPELPEIPEVPNVPEIPKTQTIIHPDMEVIRTQSIESIKISNIEKNQYSLKEDNELRELSEEEKQFLRENTSLSENAIENIRVDADGNYHLKCRNEELSGKNHEITGVKYVEKAITVDGVEITVVVPEFNPLFECDIPPEIWEAGDKAIFEYCTQQLKEYLQAHPEMKSQFNKQQLEQIMNGEPYIKGVTWHHNEVPGKMQLVDSKKHAMSGHTGGNAIWCSGIR